MQKCCHFILVKKIVSHVLTYVGVKGVSLFDWKESDDFAFWFLLMLLFIDFVS